MTKGPSLRVLVVDDNVDTAEGMAMLLRESGHDVRLAHDGLTGLEAALAFPAECDAAGYRLAKARRLPGREAVSCSKPLFKNVVLIAMTGYGQDVDRRRSQEVGFDHHFVKPVDFGKRSQQILATVSARKPRECRSYDRYDWRVRNGQAPMTKGRLLCRQANDLFGF